jgi:hypothetical protein
LIEGSEAWTRLPHCLIGDPLDYRYPTFAAAGFQPRTLVLNKFLSFLPINLSERLLVKSINSPMQRGQTQIFTVGDIDWKQPEAPGAWSSARWPYEGIDIR